MDGTTKKKMNNLNNNFQAMDLIDLIAFYAQLKNIEQDNIHTAYIHAVINRIGEEIDKLHKENDKIMEQNNYIIKLLTNLLPNS